MLQKYVEVLLDLLDDGGQSSLNKGLFLVGPGIFGVAP